MRTRVVAPARLLRRFLLAAVAACAILGASALAAAAPGAPVVDVLPFHGTVNPVSARLITAALQRAESDGAAAFVLELNTPGGGLSSMRQIALAFLGSRIPVLAYVAPQGARAGSAGTFIVYAAQLAAMAPGTEIGAAHPVGAQGSTLGSVENQKVTNDAVAMITAWAQRNGRNATWAAGAVTKAASLPAASALSTGVVNAVAPTLPAVLAELDGATVHLAGGTTTVHLRGARIRQLATPWWTSLLLTLADPNLAYILFTLGFWALVAEFVHPTLLAGVAGVLSMLLGLFGMEILSVSTVGIALLALGLGLLLFDIKAATHGVLTAGGVAAFVIGSLLLYTPVGAPGLAGGAPGLSPWLLGIAAGLSLGLGLAAAVAVHRRPHGGALPAGARDLLGHAGRVTATVRPVGETPVGQVAVGGSYWQAVSLEGEQPPGTEIEVAGVEGLTLQVWAASAPALPSAGSEPGSREGDASR